MAELTLALSGLAGGLPGYLDAIDGAILSDGDAAIVVLSDGVYYYHLNATSGATENAPFRIPPDANAGAKCWHLVGTTARIGAMLKLTANETHPSGNYNIPWDGAEYDDAAFWSAGNPTRITIPTGIVGVKLKTQVWWASDSSGYPKLALVMKNGGTFTGQAYVHSDNNATSDKSQGTQTPELVVSAGDYFEVSARQYSGLSKTINNSMTWFSVETTRFA